MSLLLREAIGGSIRRARTERRRTLRDVSKEARVSLGYLSEIERGRKEPSSELLAAICEALDMTVADLLVEAAADMAVAGRTVGAGARTDDVLVPIGQRHAELRLAGRPAGMASGAASSGTPVASAA
jgi:transcriptional regulator with XRE-family HTH domain